MDAPNHRVVKFTPSGVMSVFAGSGQAGAADGIGTAASFQGPLAYLPIARLFAFNCWFSAV
jgi:hypothetical protein